MINLKFELIFIANEDVYSSIVAYGLQVFIHDSLIVKSFTFWQ